MMQEQVLKLKMLKIEYKLAYLNKKLLDVQQIVKRDNKINRFINNKKKIRFILLTNNYYQQVNLAKRNKLLKENYN